MATLLFSLLSSKSVVWFDIIPTNARQLSSLPKSATDCNLGFFNRTFFCFECFCFLKAETFYDQLINAISNIKNHSKIDIIKEFNADIE